MRHELCACCKCSRAWSAVPAEYVAVFVGAPCVLISNILNELCQHVSSMVTDATRAVPPLARRSHAYLLFIAIHAFLLEFTPLRRAAFTQFLCSQDLLHCAKYEKSVRNIYLSFTLYVMLLGINNSMRRVIEKLVVPLLLREVPRILWNAKVGYRDHTSPPLVHVLNQISLPPPNPFLQS